MYRKTNELTIIKIKKNFADCFLKSQPIINYSNAKLPSL